VVKALKLSLAADLPVPSRASTVDAP